MYPYLTSANQAHRYPSSLQPGVPSVTPASPQCARFPPAHGSLCAYASLHIVTLLLALALNSTQFALLPALLTIIVVGAL